MNNFIMIAFSVSIPTASYVVVTKAHEERKGEIRRLSSEELKKTPISNYRGVQKVTKEQALPIGIQRLVPDS